VHSEERITRGRWGVLGRFEDLRPKAPMRGTGKVKKSWNGGGATRAAQSRPLFLLERDGELLLSNTSKGEGKAWKQYRGSKTEERMVRRSRTIQE